MAGPFNCGIAEFAESVRNGETNFESATQYCLSRIETFNPSLQAFQHVDAEGALATARALDGLLASGIDLGPLMGVPIGVKDIITVAGMPVTNGSLHPTGHLNGPEGQLLQTLRRNGIVILGKTKTVEFALGATGVNEARGTPWNPWDMQQHRIPGGSSSGSAVATAADLCAFAIGTDTGGSVRIPACYNGLFGHKTTVGLWPADGVFSLSATLDSIGPICRSAADAALIHATLFTAKKKAAISLNGLTLAKPRDVFFDDLDDEVRAGFEAVENALVDGGARIVQIDMPESRQRNEIFPFIVGPELIATLGLDLFDQAKEKMDTITRMRAAIGLEVTAEKYVTCLRTHQEWKRKAAESFTEVDAWISPTVPMLPMAVDALNDPIIADRALLSSRNTQLGNLYGLCAATLPVQHLINSELPVGFQIMMANGQDTRLLQMCNAVQQLIGTAPLPAPGLAG